MSGSAACAATQRADRHTAAYQSFVDVGAKQRWATNIPASPCSLSK
jgi:hypothetical protein